MENKVNIFDKPDIVKGVVRNKINNNKGFKYDDRMHAYTIDGVKLTSGTEWIGKYKKPFEKIYISEMVAAKNKRLGKKMITGSAVREYWTSKSKRAANLGTAGHEFCRMYWLDPEDTVPYTQLERNAKKLMDNIQKKYNIIGMEKPRGTRKFMMGFTIDLELEHIQTGKRFIGDFKFGEHFTSEQYKKHKGRLPGKLLEPFNNLRDVTYDRSSIQMGLYKYLYQLMHKVEVENCFLFHIDGIGNNYGDEGYKTYPYKSEVDKLIEQEIKTQEVSNLKIIEDMI